MKSQDAGKADYSYWLMVRVWTAHEAAALLLGYEPQYTVVSFDEFDVIRREVGIEREKLERILESAQLAGELGKVQLNLLGEPWGKTVTAAQWIKFAQRNEIGCV